jgi:hypothetical protein
LAADPPTHRGVTVFLVMRPPVVCRLSLGVSSAARSRRDPLTKSPLT